MSNKVKWTQDMRRLVYTRLRQEFGPHASWANKHSPGAHKRKYNFSLRDIADFLSASTGTTITSGAVRQQVEFGITTQSHLNARGHILSAIMNKAAALEVGFLKTSDLPTQMQMSRYSERKPILELTRDTTRVK